MSTTTNDEEKASTSTDKAIARCEEIISSHSKQARSLLLILLAVTYIFLAIILIPFILKSKYSEDSKKPISFTNENTFIAKLNTLDTLSSSKYDSLMSKAISYQKLLNEKISQVSSNNTEEKEKSNVLEYILYGVFVLTFSVLASLYRLQLKEISRQEHYLIGFQRIRIAAMNSKYDQIIKVALTQNAFEFDLEKGKKDRIQSPVKGHPGSDITTEVLNKILDKLDIKSKETK